MTRRNPAEIATGLLVLLVAAVFFVYALLHSGRSTAGGYDLHASFDHIDGLSVGSDVRLAGVKVGSVTAAAIDPKSFLAKVTFTMQDAVHLPDDSSAEITSDGLLGGKYLNIGPGGSDTLLKPGGVVTVTQGSVSLEQLLGKFIFSVGGKPDAGKSDAGKPDAGKPASGGAAPAGAVAPAP